MPFNNDPRAIPRAALVLGIVGALPFMGCAIQVAFGWPLQPRMIGPALYALNIYGAIILAFMGGVQWGLAVARSDSGWLAYGLSEGGAREYGVSVLPAFVAFAGLWFAPPQGLWLLAAGFIALLIYDLWTVLLREAPPWYGRLRIGLTAVVVACLVLAARLGPF
jgi:hypothetical protein